MKTKTQIRVGALAMSACLASCRKILSQIRKAKDAIVAESRDLLDSHEQLLRLAVNEAEALAWQTMYPHLVFPMLAMEKVRTVTEWNARQQSVQQRTAGLVSTARRPGRFSPAP